MTSLCPNGCGPMHSIWWVPGRDNNGITFRPVAVCHHCRFVAYERQPGQLS